MSRIVLIIFIISHLVLCSKSPEGTYDIISKENGSSSIPSDTSIGDIPSDTSMGDNNILYELYLDKTKYDLKEKIKIDYSLKNISNKELVVTCPNTPAFGFYILRNNNRIYNWPKGFYTSIINIVLKPNESKHFISEWEQIDDCGNYISSGEYSIVSGLATGIDNDGAVNLLEESIVSTLIEVLLEKK